MLQFVMAGCSRNDFFCMTFSFPLWHYQLCYAKKKKKILSTLNAFEDEQSNYKAGWGQMWPTRGIGPVGVGKSYGSVIRG